MSKSSRFDYKALIDAIDHTLDDYDEPQLDRAWEIVKGCIQVTARIDRKDDESEATALALAWKDFWVCFEDEEGDAPFLFWGMHGEMLQAVGERRVEFTAFVVEAGGKVPPKRKAPRKKKAPKPRRAEVQTIPTKHPHLSLVQ